MGFSHDFPSLNDAIILDPWIVEAVLGSSKARWRGSREVLLWRSSARQGAVFFRVDGRRFFCATVLLFGGYERRWSFHEFSSFHPNFLEFALCLLKVSNLNILTNIVRIHIMLLTV